MNSTPNYHVKANLTLICYNENHFVSTYLRLLRDRNTPGKVLGWRKHCSHAESRNLPAQLQCLLPTAGAACSAQQEEDFQQRGGSSLDEPRPAAADPLQECSAGPAPCPFTWGCDGVELCEVATLCSAVAAARGIERLSGDSVAKSCLQ